MARPKKHSKLVHFSAFDYTLLKYLAEVAATPMVSIIRRALHAYAQQYPGFELDELVRRVNRDAVPALAKEKDLFRLQADLEAFSSRFQPEAGGAVLADPRITDHEEELEINSDEYF